MSRRRAIEKRKPAFLQWLGGGLARLRAPAGRTWLTVLLAGLVLGWGVVSGPVQRHRAAAAEPLASESDIMTVDVAVTSADWPAVGPTWRKLLSHYGLEEGLLEETLFVNGCPNPDDIIVPDGEPVLIALSADRNARCEP